MDHQDPQDRGDLMEDEVTPEVTVWLVNPDPQDHQDQEDLKEKTAEGDLWERQVILDPQVHPVVLFMEGL